jgi:hypothetical protein
MCNLLSLTVTKTVFLSPCDNEIGILAYLSLLLSQNGVSQRAQRDRAASSILVDEVQ